MTPRDAHRQAVAFGLAGLVVIALLVRTGWTA